MTDIEIKTVGDLIEAIRDLPRDMKVFEYWESHSPGHPSMCVDTAGDYFVNGHFNVNDKEEKIVLIGSLY